MGAVALTLVAWAVRLHGLGSQSLWFDEGYSYQIASQGPRAILRLLAREDRHPPLHYLVLWASMRLWGIGEYGLRLPSAIAGTLLVAIGYGVGRRLGGSQLGLFGALFVTVSPLLVWYSQEARMYALLAALGGLSMLAWLRLASAKAGAATVVYVGATAAALYTHYYAVFLLPAQLLMPRSRRSLGAMGAALVLFVFWLPALASQGGRGSADYQPDSSLFGVLGGLASAYPLGDSFPPFAPALITFVRLAGLGVVAGSGLRRAGLFLVGWVLLAPLLAYGISRALGVELRATGRMYYLAGALPFLLLSGRGVLALRWPPLVGLTVFVLAGSQALALREQSLGRATWSRS